MVPGRLIPQKALRSDLRDGHSQVSAARVRLLAAQCRGTDKAKAEGGPVRREQALHPLWQRVLDFSDMMRGS